MQGKYFPANWESYSEDFDRNFLIATSSKSTTDAAILFEAVAVLKALQCPRVSVEFATIPSCCLSFQGHCYVSVYQRSPRALIPSFGRQFVYAGLNANERLGEAFGRAHHPKPWYRCTCKSWNCHSSQFWKEETGFYEGFLRIPSPLPFFVRWEIEVSTLVHYSHS